MVRDRVAFRHEDEQVAANRQTESLAGLALVLLLVVLCLGLVRVLSASSAIEDCLMAGRHDCDGLAAHLPFSP